MIRVQEFGEILRCAELGIHCAVIGSFGMGKSYLLKKVHKELEESIFFVNARFSKYELCRTLRSNEKSRIGELLEKLNFKYVIIDNIHKLTEAGKDVVLNLAEKSTLIVAGENLPDGLQHLFNIVKLKALDFEDSCALIKEIYKVEDKVKFEIASKCRGSPLLCVQAIKIYKATGKVEVFKRDVSRKEFRFKMLRIGYTLLSLRYLMLVQKRWELYAVMSMIAYTIISIFKYRRN